jgi:hypothetical protein
MMGDTTLIRFRIIVGGRGGADRERRIEKPISRINLGPKQLTQNLEGFDNATED